MKRIKEIVITEIDSCTDHTTGGWLDSPKAVCASIVAALAEEKIVTLKRGHALQRRQARVEKLIRINRL